MKCALSRLAALCAAALLPLAAQAGDYALEASYRLGGEGGWDYLVCDPDTGRLFITRGNRVQVVDPATGKLLGEIADTAGVHGVALAVDLGKGYTSNGRDSSVTVFDLATLRTLAKVATPGGDNPDFIVYDAASHRVFAFNGRSHDATVIDTGSDRVVATLALAGKPEAAVADGRGHVFVAIEDRNSLSRIDSAAARVTANWPLPGCDEPSGLALDAAAQRLFVGCHNRVMQVVNAESGAPVATLPIGDGVDAAAFDAQAQLAFSSQGDGTLTVVKAEGGDRYRVQQTAATMAGARTMALNPRTHEVYLVSAEFGAAPAPSASQPRPRRPMQPGSFTLLVLAPKAD
jgi:DNA-binding beta-propeller fold protein YncE